MTTLRDAMMMRSSVTRQPQLKTESSYITVQPIHLVVSYTNSLCVPTVGPQHTT